MDAMHSLPTRRRENTRLRLLDAATQVFAEVGIAAASVETICERAGFTRGAFYSNFESKDELFIELFRRVTGGRLEAVRQRISDIEARGAVTTGLKGTLSLVQEVLEVSGEDRMSVLLMSEIRTYALRHPDLAAAYLVQEGDMCESVATIVRDLARFQQLTLNAPVEEVASIVMAVWEAAALRTAMRGLSFADMCQESGTEVARVIQLLIAQPAGEAPRSTA